MSALLVCLALALRPAAALLPDEENTIKVFGESAGSVVFITNIAVGQDFLTMDEFAMPQGIGSGFVWDAQGHIVTNFHVVQGGQAFMVTLADQTQLEATVVGTEIRKDIAVLKVSKDLQKLKPLPLGDSRRLQVGQKTVAIGNPFGLDNTLTTGVVSALGRQIVGIGQVTIHDMIQTDAAINQGNSGGPLLDSDGRLIGMNTMIYSQSGASAGIGFAVPVHHIKRIVGEIIKYGKVIQPGIGAQPLEDQVKYRLLGDVPGVVVLSVRPGSPADKAGMRGMLYDRRTGRAALGDIITGIDQESIRDFDDLYNALDRHKVGDTVTVRTVRDGKTRSYRVQLVNVL